MKRVAFIIWTAGFAGLVPVAPGTAGSVVGLGLLMLVRTVGNDWAELLVLLMVVIVGIWSANVAERHYRREDPGEIVIDEVAGMMLTVFWLPSGWVPFVIASTSCFHAAPSSPPCASSSSSRPSAPSFGVALPLVALLSGATPPLLDIAPRSGAHRSR